jgi:hypothetical protein
MNPARLRGDSTTVADPTTVVYRAMSADATVIADAPTRLRSVSTFLVSVAAGSAPPARAAIPLPPSTRKRVALSAALVASFVLGVGARSLGGLRPVASTGEATSSTPMPAAIAAPPIAHSPIDSTQQQARPTSERPAAEAVSLVAGRGSTNGSAPVKKARLAADAFATGNYARALPVYEALAAEQPNAAYIQAATILRSWVAPATEGTRQPLPTDEPP